MTFDIIFTINVHEQLDFIIEQLKNIIFFTNHLHICIIYNYNKYIYDLLTKYNFDKYSNVKIIINKDTIEKKRWNGTLLKGIIKNIEYIIDNNIHFKHLIILSSRNILRQKILLSDIEVKYKDYFDKIKNLTSDNRRLYFNKENKFYICDGTIHDYWHCDMTKSRKWFWGHNNVQKSYWFAELNKQVDFFIGGRHESLCIPFEVIVKIIDFVKHNPKIMNDCYQFPIAMEEVIPQLLASKFATNEKMYILLEPNIIKIKRDLDVIKRERKKWEK